MIRVFMVSGVLCGLRARAPQPPDGVARRHQPRESVTSHSRARYAHILVAQQVSRHSPAPRTHGKPGKEQTSGINKSGEWIGTHTSAAAPTLRTPLQYHSFDFLNLPYTLVDYTTRKKLSLNEYHNRISQQSGGKQASWTATTYVILTNDCKRAKIVSITEISLILYTTF